MVMKERDEELALFLEMRRREKENEKNNLLLLQNSEELDLSKLESNRGSSTISKIISVVPPRKTGVEEFLNSENDKSDYEWLLTPPDTPLFPTLEKESQIPVKGEMEIRNARPTALKPRVSNIQAEPASRSNVVSKHHVTMPGLGSSTIGSRRQSSGGPTSATSRSSTPSGRPTLPSTTKCSRTSTPTSRATLTSAKPTAPSMRSSTPTRSTARASTPTSRPSLAASKTSQRSATPTLRSSTPSRAFGVSAPPTRPSSASKARPVVAKNPVQSRGSSPSVKSRPWEPSQMPGFSLDAPPNLKTSLPDRPASNTRSRPGAPSSRSSSVDASGNGKSRRQSSTPSKGRASTGFSHSNQFSMHALSRARFTDGDDESPVVIGTKMVERVVNMRKLAPPKHEDHHSAQNNSYGKSSSSGSSGFGSTLSKKSLDMAMRHMDIRRSMQGNLRPIVTSIPASSMCSLRSGSSSKSRTLSVSDSPLATSSTASSEPSVNNNSSISYDGSEIEENDFGIER
ncbi:cell wall protein RBR3-like [Gastrolobium bilobum]|uniref:cell wall protein RBR3-like n=1 Tax=Gastrolobium bilobum TaxID=150636 RepID=UPI002AAFF067|nr:cell wall protein RBR3-like [Gastrolobium bilobum]XP_061344592.1 cell wall protein RBR3-like [Gastrolobium bilobum]